METKSCKVKTVSDASAALEGLTAKVQKIKHEAFIVGFLKGYRCRQLLDNHYWETAEQIEAAAERGFDEIES